MKYKVLVSCVLITKCNLKLKTRNLKLDSCNFSFPSPLQSATQSFFLERKLYLRSLKKSISTKIILTMKKQKLFFSIATFALLISVLSFKYYFPGNQSKPIDPTTFNTSVKPGDDFYEYINSNWVKANPIPSSRAKWGSFYILDDSSQAVIHRIVLNDAANTKAALGSSTQKVGDFFAAGMDSATCDAAGYKPIQKYLDEINAIKTADDLIRCAAHQQMIFNGVMFGEYVDADQMQSSMNVMNLYQGGLSLPSKDFYFNKQTENIRTAYKKYVSSMFELIGSDAKKCETATTSVWDIEVALANFSKDNVELRDPYANYHKMTYAELKSSMPNFNWDLFFSTLGAKDVGNVVVGQPVFFDQLNKMMKSVSIEDWKNYLTFHMVDYAAGELSSSFEKTSFDFHGTTLNGIKQMKPRWRRVLENENGAMGELIGQEYVIVKFTADAKSKALDLIHNLITMLGQRINGLDWMSDITKKKAIEKLNMITVKVGYPDKWKDYSSVNISRTDYFGNLMACTVFEFQRNMAKLNKPVDRSEWGMTPQTVNAYYNPTNNEIVFPAAILQPPFFDANADNAVNYGGIGVVIGHELTHGFDDQGRLYDGSGNLNNWWTPQDSTNYTKKTDLIVKHFGAFCPQDSLCINGNLTLGENIADNGGSTVSYYAFLAENKLHPQAALIDGLTPEQRFFVSFAIIWRGSFTPQAMRQQLMTNPHSPGKWRVLGTLGEMPEFYAAFNIKQGDKMWRAADDRARIW